MMVEWGPTNTEFRSAGITRGCGGLPIQWWPGDIERLFGSRGQLGGCHLCFSTVAFYPRAKRLPPHLPSVSAPLWMQTPWLSDCTEGWTLATEKLWRQSGPCTGPPSAVLDDQTCQPVELQTCHCRDHCLQASRWPHPHLLPSGHSSLPILCRPSSLRKSKWNPTQVV